MKRIAELAVRRRWLVVVGWVGFVIGVQVIAGVMGGASYRDTFSLPHTETASVTKLLEGAGLNNQSGASGTVVLKNKDGKFTSSPPELKSAFTDVCASGNHVAFITSPWDLVDCSKPAADAEGNPKLLNSARGSTAALITVTWENDHYEPEFFKGVYDELKTLRSDSLQVEFTGPAFNGIGQSEGSGSSIFIGFAAALVILALVFRTVAATVLPLASALFALVGGLGVIYILSHAIDVSNITPVLAELMVIGVGVDYALFIVTRHRRNLRRGVPVAESIVNAVNTSGRAVLFAGTTVCIAILGLIALGVKFFNGMAVATALAVGFTMIASLTLLPALLSLFGLKVLTRKQRAAVRAGEFIDDQQVGFWARWSQFVARQRIGVAVVSGALMILITVPFFSLQLGASDQGSDPKSSTTRVGYDLIASEFGVGYNSALEAVVSGPGAADEDYLQRVSETLSDVPGVDPASLGTMPLAKDVAFVTFKTTTSPQSEETYKLVRHLRSDILPPLYDGTANHIYTYGDTAINVDFASVLSRKMPLFIAVVVGLSFVLLLIAFRSLLIPLTAALMNLLAAGGSFGLSVAIFQYGWLSEPMGAGPGGPIDAWMPVMLFAILFGLSMDYQVFLVSRMHEEWLHNRDNKRSVVVGQAETGGIITAAAIIMIAVFLGFVLTPGRPIKIFGVGLASAVFLDAFILRTALVPSLMHLIGKANWYLPKWLERVVPHVSVEPADEPVTVGTATHLAVGETASGDGDGDSGGDGGGADGGSGGTDGDGGTGDGDGGSGGEGRPDPDPEAGPGLGAVPTQGAEPAREPARS
ncbi:putative drug exporter of the RND superfamily [Parafrankia irregularis]|uniref:Putative drug exporter of the RND superfamily n=1 Tax=Parafrankia irregularis TaxID=795642 RepID=A0A0S4QW92_9ACTN|nr:MULTISPECIES: efflux RND transporter permease subunit [Parafrankia]MBE3206441.1 MMPL family transporter [Parafrankia sp. CH37]CUU59889.1 putative drug exporter of the RND superfamily [Parafrankia irregularis]